jgi:hypothetical protein
VKRITNTTRHAKTANRSAVHFEGIVEALKSVFDPSAQRLDSSVAELECLCLLQNFEVSLD